MVHSVHQSCVGLWGVAWILQWVLTECRTPCSRSRPCSISSTSSCPGVWFPLCGKGALLCPSSNGATPISPPTIAQSLLRRAASNSSSIWSISALDRSSLPISTSAREDSDGVLMCWSVHSLMFCHHADLPTFVAFVDLQKAFDTAWVEGTLVRLHEVGVTGQMWHLMCHLLRDTVRVGASLSAPWPDNGIAQGSSSLTLTFQFAHRQLAPGVRLLSHHRFSNQLYADDLVVVADCEHDLQVSCDVVAAWAGSGASIWRGTHQICSHGVWAHQTCAHLYSDLGRGFSRRFPSILTSASLSCLPSLGFPTFAN